MSQSTASLWPESIRADVETPYAILRTQAATLHALTSGVLEGTVEATRLDSPDISLRLSVHAPALNYKHLILSVKHQKTLPYPATVRAECFEEGGSRFDFTEGTSRSARNPESLKSIVRDVLRSPEVEGVLVSLIARSNDPSEPEYAGSEEEGMEAASPTH